MDYLLWPMQLFVWHPFAALAMAAAFAGLLFLDSYARRPKVVLGVVALVWLAYAGWEAYVTQWRSSSGDMAIRVEMLLLGPVLLVALIVGLATAVFRYKRAVSKTRKLVAAVPGRRVSRESRTGSSSGPSCGAA